MPRKPRPEIKLTIQRLSDGQIVGNDRDDFTGEPITPLAMPKQELRSGDEIKAEQNREAWDARARLLKALFSPQQVVTSSNKPWRRM